MREPDFLYIQSLVREEAGLVLEKGKAYLADLRLNELARREGAATAQELVERLREPSANGLRRRAVEALLVHETRFFRDENVFELLRRSLLPDLLDRPGRPGALGFWSAGCATGQEAYSLAMLCREELPGSLAVRILATDYSESALERARQGIYSPLEMSRGLPDDLRARYFTPLEGGDWQAKPEIRGMVDFRLLNLVRDWGPMLPVDVVFLRNVMIYFDIETKKGLLARIKKVLKPHGCLFLGGTEAALMLDPSFRLVERHRAWCYQIASAPGGRP